jgi:putative ABC transport system permease protein
MERFVTDARLSLRIFRRSPVLALGAVVALALGVGLTTTMFSIVRGGTRPLPFEEPHELVAITRTVPAQGRDLSPAAFDYLAWSRAQRTFDALAAFEERSVNLASEGDRPERRQAAFVTPGTFGLVGATAALGRVLLDDDARPGAPAVVLLGDDLWRSRFDGDSAVVGRTIRLDGAVHTVVGVMPPRFGFPVRAALWAPLAVAGAPPPTADDGGLRVFGRLRDGVALDQARLDLARIAEGLARESPVTHRERSARVLPFVELELDANTPAILTLMLACVSFVLLIACANVANLLLARAATRGREFAVRTALGATRARLVALHLFESLALSAVGGALGFAMATAAVPAFARATSGILDAFWIDFRVDGAVALFATVAVGLAGILAGVVPGLRASRVNVADALRDAAVGSTGIQLGRLARSLVVAEVALATGLLIMTMTFTRTAVALRAVEMPFDARGILTAQLSLTQRTLDDPEARARVAQAVMARLAGTAGVQAVGLASVLPGRGAGGWPVSLDAPTEPGSSAPRTFTGLVHVTPGFFEVLGARARSGRLITEADRPGAPIVAVVNESWVRRFSPERDPVGRRLFVGERALEVVGVVPDLQMQDPEDRDGAGVYVSLYQLRPFAVRLLARTTGEPLALANVVRDAAEAVDPDLPVFEVATLHDAIFSEKRVLDAFATIFLVAGAGALFLTMLGVYGIVSFAVASRTREIGVRVALGASPRAILRLVLRQGAWLVGGGTALGLLLAFGLSQALAAATEYIQPASASSYLAIAGALLVTAVMALVRPVTRALRLDPVEALREW